MAYHGKISYFLNRPLICQSRTAMLYRTSVALLLSLLLLGGGLPVAAQPMATAAPEAVGLSSARLARVEPLMQRYIDEGKLAGILTMVARQGQVVHFETYGHRDREAQDPMAEDTIFRIYSMTKPITSTAVLMLYEEGHFLLDDPVADYLPAFADLTVYAPDGDPVALERPVTIRDLLTHTSGLSYGFFSQTPVDSLYQQAGVLNGETSLASFVDKLGTLPLLHQPGERWHYSVATDVLGYLVEVVAGQPFGAFLEDRIFGPLGMDETSFEVATERLERFAVNYAIDQEGQLVVQDAAGAWSPFAAPVQFHSGGGGLTSTAADYMRFAQMLLNGGQLDGVRLLSPKTVELMTMNHLDGEFEPGWGFGLGVNVSTNVARTQTLGSVGTYGWSGAANTYFFIDPEEELIAMVWTQLFPYGYYPLFDEFKVAVYQAIVE